MNIDIKDVKEVLKKRANDCNKGDFGKTGLFGGSLNYSGAIRLAYLANIAMKSGTGLVRIITDKKTAKLIAPTILEATIWPLEDNLLESIKDLDVLVIGIGLLENTKNEEYLKVILENFKQKLVIDAGALNMLAKNTNLLINTKAKVVLTPHIKEFSRLTNVDIKSIKKEPLRYAQEFSQKYKVIVLLKGAKTIVTDASSSIIIDYPVPGLATAGSGDVLSGVLGAILAYNSYNVKTIASAAYLNATAGRIAMEKYSDISMVASDTINSITDAIKEIRNK